MPEAITGSPRDVMKSDVVYEAEIEPRDEANLTRNKQELEERIAVGIEHAGETVATHTGPPDRPAPDAPPWE